MIVTLPLFAHAGAGLNYGHISGNDFVVDTDSGLPSSVFSYWAVYDNVPYATTTEILGGTPASTIVTGTHIGLSGLGITSGNKWIGIYSNTPASVTNNLYAWYFFSYDGTNYTTSGFPTDTRFDYVEPYNGETEVSSTSPVILQAGGYINKMYTGDLDNNAVDNANKNGIQVKWNVYSNVQPNNCIDVICAVGGGIGGTNYYSGTGFLVFPTYGFNVSTTTTDNLATGYYTLTTSIIRPSTFFGLTGFLGMGFGQDTLLATTTYFQVGTPTAGQTALNNLYNATKSGVAGLTATSSASSLASCSPFSLDLGTCLAVLFLPSQKDMQDLIQFAHDNFLNRAPWGYATRMVLILTNNATTTASTSLPTWTITFPLIQGKLGSPLSGNTLSFDMQEMLDNGSSTLNGIVDPISGKTLKEITEPYILLFIAISALIIVFHDIMGMGIHTNKYADK
jgi:hypothetical protein